MMSKVIAADVLASAARQQSIPVWALVLIGAVGAVVCDRIPKVRNAKMWQRYLFVALAGAGIGVIAWCVGYFFFNVDLT